MNQPGVGFATPSSCPICQSDEVRPYCAKGDARYYACRSCEVLFQYPLPDRETMQGYADEEYDDGGLYREYVDAREMKLAHFRARMDAVRSRLKGGKLLDVGCSCGYFLEVASGEGYDIQGLEFSPNAAKSAREDIQARIFVTSIDALDRDPDDQYDVITAFDIIEHLDKPLEFLKCAERMLKPGGTLIVTTPDAGHWLRPLMRSRWPMLQPMQHLTIFSRRSLRRALEETGFVRVHLEAAKKTITYQYLVNQLRTLNPLLFPLLRTTVGMMPSGAMARHRQVNIGEVLALASKPN